MYLLKAELITDTPKKTKSLRYSKYLKSSFTTVNSNLKYFESLDI